MPIPFASSKHFYYHSKFFDHGYEFLNTVNLFWPYWKVRFFLINFHIWEWSKVFDHIQKILNTLLFYQIKPLKKGPFLILPSSIAKDGFRVLSLFILWMLTPLGFTFVEKNSFVENKMICKFSIKKVTRMEYYSCKRKGFKK